MSLNLDVKVGDTIVIDEGKITLQLVKKKGQQVRISVDAPRDIPVSVMDEHALARARGLSNRYAMKSLG